MNIQPYLFFNGTCEEAFTFYAKAFGGEILMMRRYEDMPAGEEGCDDSEEGKAFGKKIMHARIQVGDAIIMGSDAHPRYEYKGMHGFRVNLGFDTGKEAEAVFAALAKDAQEIMMPVAETFWAERFGMLTDKYGTPWMVNGGEHKGP